MFPSSVGSPGEQSAGGGAQGRRWVCRAPLGLATRGSHLPGRTQCKARARAEKGSAQERRPLRRQDPASPESSRPGAQSLGPSERLGGRRAGARLRVRVSSWPPGGSSGQWAAEKEPRRPATEAAEDPRGAGSRDANSAGAEPGASHRRHRRPPSPAERRLVGTVTPSACRALARAAASQARGAGRKGGGGGGRRGATPARVSTMVLGAGAISASAPRP